MSIAKPKIVERWQKKNKYGRPGTYLKATKVAIHYTGQADVEGCKTVSYFNNVVANGYKVNGKYVYASAHFVIDLDGTIYQLIPTNERCYATNSANSYAIGIEVATTGKDNHYTDATYKSMVHLCAWLCHSESIDCKKDIITHTDVVGKSYKLCPIYMVKNPSKMTQFKLDAYNLKAGKIKVADIKNCTNDKGEVTKVPTMSTATSTDTSKMKLIKNISNENINIRNIADWNGKAIGQLRPGDSLTYVSTVDAKNGNTKMYKTILGTYVTASNKYTKLIEL